jgi:hypothetical protein
VSIASQLEDPRRPRPLVFPFIARARRPKSQSQTVRLIHFSSEMPQLWKTSRPPERPAGPASLAKSFDASNGPRRPAAANLPPLIVNPASDSAQHRTNGAMFGDRSPVEPTSPTSPHYDQLLIELRLAQVQPPPFCRSSRGVATYSSPFDSWPFIQSNLCVDLATLRPFVRRIGAAEGRT